MIFKVLSALNIPYPDGRTNFNIDCPVCCKKKLNINVAKGVFNCPRCGAGGGPIALYGFMKYNIDPQTAKTTEVRQQLMNEVNGFASNLQAVSVQRPVIKRIDVDPSDIALRSKCYQNFLNKLSLAQPHKDNLISRGLPEAIILKNGYKSVPLSGLTKIPPELLKDGNSLLGTPGFYQDDSDKWVMQKNASGFFVPVRNVRGEIEGLQIRADKPFENRKYYWFSSPDKKQGCGAKTWSHFVGYPEEIVYLTEGPLKADIINYFMDVPVIGIPGVNTLQNLEPMLDELRKYGVRGICTCFDMDFLVNPNVEKAYCKLVEFIKSKGFVVKMEKWDPNYKGLDDYLLYKSRT